MKGVTELIRSKKAVIQAALLICGAAMLCYGILRGEADTVLSKAIPAVSGVCGNWITKM